MSAPNSPAPDPSEIAGRYQVVQRLGAGAFGTVYKAKDRILGRMVAIKTIRLEGLAAAATDLRELTDRFKREAQVSAQLKHPNIVTIYDIGETDGTSYLAMEFIDGVGLDKLISGGPLPPERAALIGAQVADALDFAHRASVVHRDIKPANIMIEAGDRVKVTDFGIAKVTNSGEHLTMTGSLLGTPSYMSPEQARGAAIDGRSDLFSVGCVLYEMLAGKKAFRGDSITALIFKIITEEPPPLREAIDDVPEELVRVVGKALAKTPETRYQSGRELAEELLALTRAGATPTLRQAETPTSPGMAGAPPTIVSAGKGASPTVMSPPTANAAPAPPPPPTAARRAPPPPPPPVATPAKRKHSSTGLLLGLAAVGLVVLALAGAAGWYLFRSQQERRTADLSATVQDDTQPSAVPSEAPLASVRPPEPSAPATAEPEASTDTAVEPPPPSAVAPPPATPTGNRTASANVNARPAATLPPPPATRPAPSEGEAMAPEPSQDFSFLDQEPPPVDGVEAGRRLADSFRNGRSTSGSFGTNQRFRARDRSPRDLSRGEFPAVATMRHVINCQEAFYRKHSRYGTLLELKAEGLLRLDVPVQARQFQRQNYAFDLQVEAEGFRVDAAPRGGSLRPFVGDDSGIIRAGTE
jgi:serine/threonine protein kinase